MKRCTVGLCKMPTLDLGTAASDLLCQNHYCSWTHSSEVNRAKYYGDDCPMDIYWTALADFVRRVEAEALNGSKTEPK